MNVGVCLAHHMLLTPLCSVSVVVCCRVLYVCVPDTVVLLLLGICVQATRFARVCLEEAMRYSFKRSTFGKKLIGKHTLQQARGTLTKSHWDADGCCLVADISRLSLYVYAFRTSRDSSQVVAHGTSSGSDVSVAESTCAGCWCIWLLSVPALCVVLLLMSGCAWS